MDPGIGEFGQRELVRGGEGVREVSPEREVHGGAIGSASYEEGVEDPVSPRNVDRPTQEMIGDDTERRTAFLLNDVGNELIEGGLEGLGGLEEINEEVEGDVSGGLGGGWEAMGGWGEGESSKADGGGGWEGGAEVLDVERGADEGYGAGGVPAVDELGEGEEGGEMALGQEGEENYMIGPLAFHFALRGFES